LRSDHQQRIFTAIFIVCFFILLTAATVGTAMASFSLEDERKLGKEFYEKLVKENVLLQNDRVNAFVNLVGQRVLAHSEKVAFDFKFSVIRSSAINAFATPGGYVYLNEGLINLVENEGQLAGVIAHEIGHVNGRHISEIIDRSQKLSISALAAILAGAFLGGGGDVTAAVTSFSLAAATAFSLKYSREQEEAADRMGMSYLVSAGYDAHWADGLALMQVSVSGFARMAGIIKSLADELCGGRLVLTLEGGYNLDALAASVKATFDVLLGNSEIEDPLGPSPRRPAAHDIASLIASVRERGHLG